MYDEKDLGEAMTLEEFKKPLTKTNKCDRI